MQDNENRGRGRGNNRGGRGGRGGRGRGEESRGGRGRGEESRGGRRQGGDKRNRGGNNQQQQDESTPDRGNQYGGYRTPQSQTDTISQTSFQEARGQRSGQRSSNTRGNPGMRQQQHSQNSFAITDISQLCQNGESCHDAKSTCSFFHPDIMRGVCHFNLKGACTRNPRNCQAHRTFHEILQQLSFIGKCNDIFDNQITYYTQPDFRFYVNFIGHSELERVEKTFQCCQIHNAMIKLYMKELREMPQNRKGFAVATSSPNGEEISFNNVSNKMSIHVHENVDTPPIQVGMLYKYDILSFFMPYDPKIMRIEVNIVEMLGPLGDPQAEFKLLEQEFFGCTSRFRDYEDPASLENEMKKTVFMGKFQVDVNDYQYSIKSELGKVFPGRNANRAVDGSTVYFRREEQTSNQRGGRGGKFQTYSNKTVKIINVQMPKALYLHGIIHFYEDKLLFEPMNRKYPAFQVTSIGKEFTERCLKSMTKEEEKSKTEDQPFFSAIYPWKSQFINHFVDNDNGSTFFRIKLIDWVKKSDSPFGEIRERYGSKTNINDCIKMIAAENNIDPDGQDFGQKAKDSVKRIDDQCNKLIQDRFVQKQQEEVKNPKSKKKRRQKQSQKVSNKVQIWQFWPKSNTVFSIDSKGTKSLDDCLSIEEFTDDLTSKTLYRVSVHISFVDYWIKEDSPVDQEAKQRVESIYLGKTKDFYRPMLPNKIGKEVASLKKGQPKLATTVSFVLNEEGLVDFTTVEYQHSVIENEAQMSYEKAEKILEEQQEKDELQLMQEKLKLLMRLTKSIRSIRAEQCNVDIFEKSALKDAVEELMWLTKLVLPGYKESIINTAQSKLTGQKQKLEELRKQKLEELRLEKIRKQEEKQKRAEEQKRKREEAKKRKEERRLKQKAEKEAKKSKRQQKIKELKDKLQTRKERKQKDQPLENEEDKEFQDLEEQLRIAEAETEASEAESSSQSEFEESTKFDEISEGGISDISDADLGELSESEDSEGELEEQLFKLDNEAINEATSKGAENFLRRLFELIGCEIDFTSWKMVQSSFQNAYKKNKGKILEEYLQTCFATNFQYMALIIKRNSPVQERKEREKKSKQKEKTEGQKKARQEDKKKQEKDQPEQKNSGTEKACHKCRQQGHLTKNCPTVQRGAGGKKVIQNESQTGKPEEQKEKPGRQRQRNRRGKPSETVSTTQSSAIDSQSVQHLEEQQEVVEVQQEKQKVQVQANKGYSNAPASPYYKDDDKKYCTTCKNIIFGEDEGKCQTCYHLCLECFMNEYFAPVNSGNPQMCEECLQTSSDKKIPLQVSKEDEVIKQNKDSDKLEEKSAFQNDVDKLESKNTPKEKDKKSLLNEQLQKNNRVLLQVTERLLFDLTGQQINISVQKYLVKVKSKVKLDQAFFNLYVSQGFEEKFSMIIDSLKDERTSLAQKLQLTNELVSNMMNSILQENDLDDNQDIPKLIKPSFITKVKQKNVVQINIDEVQDLLKKSQIQIKDKGKAMTIKIKDFLQKFFDPHFHIMNTEGPHDNGILDPPHGGKVFSVFDYENMMRGVNLVGGAVVEVISDKVEEEALWFASELSKSQTPYTIVAGIDMTVDIKELIEKYQQIEHFRGVRHILNFEPSWPKIDRNLLDDVQVILNLKHLEINKVSFDLQLNPHQFKRAADILKKIPDLVVIVDHCGSPTIDDINTEEYIEGIRLLAECPNTYMKVSFLGYTDPKWNLNEQLLFKVREVIRIFTPQRCMFASNFPVDSKEQYGSWTIERLVEAFNLLAQDFDKKDQEYLWYLTAQKAYRPSQAKQKNKKKEQKGEQIIDTQSEQIIIREPYQYVFEKDLFDNKLTEFLSTSANKELKFHNPLRDYSHLITGRLISKLIDVKKQYSSIEEPTKTSVSTLRDSIDAIQKQYKKVVAFQEQAKNVAECNQKLKRAQREIEKMRIAHEMGNQERTFKVLKVQKGLWQPTLHEFQMDQNHGSIKNIKQFEEFDVTVSVKDLVPLIFEGNKIHN